MGWVVVPGPLRTRDELCGTDGTDGTEREGLTWTLDPAPLTEAFGVGATRTFVPLLPTGGSG
jgi:hypothetical protein